MPVAWYRTYQSASGKPGRVFTTTHGASEDLLNDGFRRMAVNATLWAAGLEASIRPTGNISFVGPYPADDVRLRRVREGHEALGPGGLGLADPARDRVGSDETARMRSESVGASATAESVISDKRGAGSALVAWRWRLVGATASARAAADVRAAAERPHLHHRQHAGRADAVRRLARDDAPGALPEARAGLPQPRVQRRRDRHAPALEELRHARRVAERPRRSRSAATKTTASPAPTRRPTSSSRSSATTSRMPAQAGLDAFKKTARRLDHAHARAEIQRQVRAARRAVLADRARGSRQSGSARRQGEQPAPGALHQGDGRGRAGRTTSRSSISSRRAAKLYADSKAPLTIQGVHLNDAKATGRSRRSSIARCSATPPKHAGAAARHAARRRSSTRTFYWFQRYRVTDGYSTYGDRAFLTFVRGNAAQRQRRSRWPRTAKEDVLPSNYDVLQRELPMLDVMTRNRDRRIWAVAPRIGDLKVDDCEHAAVHRREDEPAEGASPFMSGAESHRAR